MPFSALPFLLLSLLPACASAEAVALEGLDGKRHLFLEDVITPRTPPTAVLLGATWCPYTNAALGAFQELAEEHPDARFFVVVVGEDAEKAGRWAEKRGIRVPVLLDSGGLASRLAGEPQKPGDAVGAQVLLDREGKTVLRALKSDPAYETGLERLGKALKELEGGEEALVTVSAPREVKVKRGGTALWTLRLTVAPGYHVQANPPSQPNLYPVRAELEPAEGIEAGPARYPKGREHRLSWSKRALSVYEGTFEVVLPVRAGGEAARGKRALEGRVRWQACDDRRCLFPDEAEVPLTLVVE